MRRLLLVLCTAVIVFLTYGLIRGYEVHQGIDLTPTMMAGIAASIVTSAPMLILLVLISVIIINQRSVFRRRRGRCATCGYIGNAAVCSECGKPPTKQPSFGQYRSFLVIWVLSLLATCMATETWLRIEEGIFQKQAAITKGYSNRPRLWPPDAVMQASDGEFSIDR